MRRASRRRFFAEAGATIAAALGVTAAVLAPDPSWGSPVEAPGGAKLLRANTASRDFTRRADPDAHLLSLCASYHAVHARRTALSAAWDADTAAGFVQATDTQWDAAWSANVDAEHNAADAVLPVSPTTLHGLAAKAAVAQSVAAGMRSPGELLNFQEVCADQVLADALALAGRA